MKSTHDIVLPQISTSLPSVTIYVAVGTVFRQPVFMLGPSKCFGIGQELDWF